MLIPIWVLVVCAIVAVFTIILLCFLVYLFLLYVLRWGVNFDFCRLTKPCDCDNLYLFSKREKGVAQFQDYRY